MKRLGHRSVAVDEVEHLVEQQQHGSSRRGEHPRQRLCSRRRGRRGITESLDASITRQLPCQVDPRRLPTRAGIPGVAHEHPNTRRWNLDDTRVVKELRDAGHRLGSAPCSGEVVQRSQGVGLAAAKLGDQCQDRRSVLRPA